MASRVPPHLVLAFVAALAWPACAGDSKDAGSVVPSDTSVGPADVLVTADSVVAADTRFDPRGDGVGADVDAEPGPDIATTALTALKEDPDWLVPGGVAARTAVAVADTRVAWVEQVAGGAPQLVVWDSASATDGPRGYAVPNLAHPRELALGDAALVYVDDRYGDADLFSLELASGVERALVARPGAQEHPAVLGDAVVWADCRDCVSGDGGLGREIYRRQLAALGAPEVRLTVDAVPDDGPALGTLADGSVGGAWVADGTRLRVVSVVGAVGAATDVTLEVPTPVIAVALTDGVLAFRPQPVIINPDSMRPTDVRLWDLATGVVTAATFHAELAPGMDGAPRAADGRVAWLDAVTGAAPLARATVADPAGAVDFVTTVPGAVTLVVSGSRLALLAPRADNDGLLDLWIRVLP